MAVAKRSPEEIKRVKGMGFLVNRGTDNFNARIITVNGKISAEQQRKIAEAAEKFGNGTITFTSRLTIEVPFGGGQAEFGYHHAGIGHDPARRGRDIASNGQLGSHGLVLSRQRVFE